MCTFTLLCCLETKLAYVFVFSILKSNFALEKNARSCSHCVEEMCLLRCTYVNDLKQYLNSIEERVQWTMAIELEEERKLLFTDILITRLDNKLVTKV